MESFRIIDPKANWRRLAERAHRPPSARNLIADAAAELARLDVLLRAYHKPLPQECPYCGPVGQGLYEQPPGGCPACTPPTPQHNGPLTQQIRAHGAPIRYGPAGRVLSVR
jgi:hypothetical protein